jgi:hypothetical protein
MSKKIDNNGKHQLLALFGEMEWGPKARSWSQSMTWLTTEQWRVITAEATAHSRRLP